MSIKITFHIEPSDRSVGIMAEGFSAWEESGTSWCDLSEMNLQAYKFGWFSNDTGDKTERPANADVIEALLKTFIEQYYVHDDYGDE